MNKEIVYDGLLKLKAGCLTPAPPVGLVLSPLGVNTKEFCTNFNKWSKDFSGVIEVGIIVYDDLSYKFLIKEQYLAFKKNELDVFVSNVSKYSSFDELRKALIEREVLSENGCLKKRTCDGRTIKVEGLDETTKDNINRRVCNSSRSTLLNEERIKTKVLR